MHKKKRSLSLTHEGEMKIIVNASQNLTLLMIKHEDVLNETFKKDASNEKFNVIDVAYACNKIFKDSNRLPLKEGKQDVTDLQQSNQC